MLTQRFYWVLTLILLLTLTVSCGVVPVPARDAEHPSRSPAPVSPADYSSTPVLSTVEATVIPPTATPPAPEATKKPPKGTKAPGGNQGQGQGSDQPGGPSQSLSFEIPEHSLDVILGRPTDTSITFSLLSPANDQTLLIAYGTQSENYTFQTEQIALQAGVPQTVQLSNLQPDTQYYYTLDMGAQENTFHTARAPGSTFIFTIQADSHLDSNTSAEVYLQTLANQRADHPDFMIDLGDTFMTEKYKPYTDALPQYLAQRYFFGQLGMPLYLVLGNHDGEGAPRGNASEDVSIWSAQQRTAYFPNPSPNDFYTGNTGSYPAVGDLQNYYAWEWGDALFIVLDPYWYTPPTKGSTTDLWNPTLGNAQYQWLKATLETSNAKWKFVFIHQLIGGLEKDGRGGIEVAPFHEWGGNNPDGTYAFDQYRPGWDMPIHQLLLANHVSAVFHGHDHLFVHQELDGIIYQEVPQPGGSRSNTDSAAEYGYLSGDILGGPGHMRITVSPEQVLVEYVRSYVDEKPNQQNGQVDYYYTIK